MPQWSFCQGTIAHLTGLAINTVYHFRLIAANKLDVRSEPSPTTLVGKHYPTIPSGLVVSLLIVTWITDTLAGQHRVESQSSTPQAYYRF